MGKVLSLNNSNFKGEVIESKGLVLVDFWADWCGPCKMLAPILEELSGETEAKICKVNVDESGDLAGDYGIRSIPTMIIFKDGVKVDQIVGLRQKSELLEKLNSY
ncbi:MULTISPECIES: thioredoxin [Cetobacterium]|jgi:thioredoxin 1|uniref:Thioredoxin n=1 Tax=Cetobacterium somerae ATCC BAA-474 TaxID=1319815 RepID=U7VB97_9FUSO|nr:MULTISPECIES: thioredoxin [Cetobacterium]ERT68068.1 thioredoxin [Cetobacterium somerae ATCC BAA-474]MBC2853007.1 thioredoxin [Cetobacterium sp. 2G large]MCQ8211625.1 thioredoxin [Cetobacterium sp. NK01]MCQ9626991.1 thioredoxin [Cetobacterium somerae]MCX3067495.1 thioredoxin [Cetobacterium somerae]